MPRNLSLLTLAAAILGVTGLATSATAAPVFSAFKGTWEAFDWNTNVIGTKVSGQQRDIGTDVLARHVSTVTLAFATGACGKEDWSGADGGDVGAANTPLLLSEGVRYILSTGGAGGTFTCDTDAAMSTFIDRWNSPNFVGVDFDLENGQSAAVIDALMARVKAAHQAYPALRFSFTIATEAVNNGGTVAVPGLGQGRGAQDPYDGLDGLGNQVMASVQSVLGWDGTAANWPAYVLIDLMTMDFGPAKKAYCVVQGKSCQMGQSTVQAAENMQSVWNVPYSGIEVTPMIGGNDNRKEFFVPADVDTVSAFALAQGLAGVHYWAWDRDRPCPKGKDHDNCNSMGKKTDTYGYVDRFVRDGLQ